MDNFFKAIGKFFKKIWEWIRQTAWVQPVLLVLLVFLIIFSFSANSPLMVWIKSLTNPDTTGQFYDSHEVLFTDIYKDVYSRSGTKDFNCKDYEKPDGNKAGQLLKGYEGTTYVVFVTNDYQETTVKTWYDRVLDDTEKKHFYVVDFRDENNLNSDYDMKNKKWINDNGSYFYDYLLTECTEFYNSQEFADYALEFASTYGYSAKNANLNASTETWDASSPERQNAKDSLKFPIFLKYKGETLVDLRISWSSSDNLALDYPKTSGTQDTLKVLTDFKNASGVTKA
jgi:hypothetical protein